MHADGEPERLPVYLEAVRTGELPGGWAADDGVGLHFSGTRWSSVVSSRPGAAACRVDAVEGELVRQRIEPELLGAAPGTMPPPSAPPSRSCAPCSASAAVVTEAQQQRAELRAGAVHRYPRPRRNRRVARASPYS